MVEHNLRIFVSYSKSDIEFFNLLNPSIERCKREYGFQVLSDLDIPKGADWNNWITDAITSSDIFICMVSREYLSTDYISTTEIPLMKQECSKGAILIPIYARYCRLEMGSIFLSTQGMNKPDFPLSDMSRSELDRFFAAMEHDLLKIGKELLKGTSINTPNDESGNHRKLQLIDNDHIGANMSIVRYNIVIVGRTGTGKSELINYIFGSKMRESGTGLPITEPGFHRLDMMLDGIPSTIFDSWGLETDGAEAWMKDLSDELSKRTVNEPVKEWFHTVIYCIQASCHRIEPFELKVLNRFKNEKYRVIVALTKADAVSEDETTKLETVIHSQIGHDVPCIPICSVEIKTRTGRTERFGLIDLITEIRKGFWVSITKRVPSRCILILCKYFDDEVDKLIEWIEEETGLFNHNAITKQVNDRLSEIVNKLAMSEGLIENVIASEIKGAIEIYKQFENIIDDSLLTSKGYLTDTSVAAVNMPSIPTVNTTAAAKILYASLVTLSQSVTTALLGVSVSGLLAIGGPIAIGISLLALKKRKDKFQNLLIEDIRSNSDMIKNRIRDIEPELCKRIEDIPIGSKIEHC